MVINPLDLRSLEIFRTVASEGSVSRAADKLNRVQSNVSTRIRQLEKHLGKNLFIRTNRGLTLTADGQLLLSYANRLLQLSREATEALNQNVPRGVLRIGTMESTAVARLPEILSSYHELYPEVEIQIKTDVARGLVNRLLSNDVDVAFIAEPVKFDSLHAIPIFEEELVLIVPHTFPELSRTQFFSGKTMIAFEQGCAYRRYLEKWLLNFNIVPRGIIDVSSYLTMLACVSAGTGFAIVPRSVLNVMSSYRHFRLYPLSDQMQRVRTMMTWRAGYQSVNLNALKAFLPTI